MPLMDIGDWNLEEKLLNSQQIIENQIKVLSELDITNIPEEYIKQKIKLLQMDHQINTMELLLSDALCIVYDESLDAYIPDTKNAFCLYGKNDDLDTMYTKFLRCLDAISCGDFIINDIEEDLSSVDFEDRDGTYITHFKYNETLYTYEARVYKSWFDLHFMNKINDIFSQNNNPKKLYCTVFQEF